jgi:hypothetical protein
MLARKRDKSAAKDGRRKGPVGASSAKCPHRDTLPSDAEAGLPSKRKIWVAGSVVVAIVFAVGLGFYLLNGIESAGKATGASAATFVGSETCAGFHQAEANLWDGSHHKQAMDHATEASVSGDFGDASFEHYGVRSRFFRKDGEFT